MMRRNFRKIAVSSLCAAFLGIWPGSSAVYAVPVYRPSFDVGPGDVKGFIEALNAANASQSPVSINLAANATYTFTVAAKGPASVNGVALSDDDTGPDALPAVTGNVTINGNGATLQRSGSAKFRFFETYMGKLTVNDLTVKGGDVTGATNSNGGAIQVSIGSLTLNRCTLTGNSAGAGGAIENDGTLVVNDSHIDGNSATGNGGGLENSIAMLFGGATLTNTEIANNRAGDTNAGGGIYNGAGLLTLVNSRVEQNTAQEGGGIDNDVGATLQIKGGSVIAGNRALADSTNADIPLGGGGINNAMGSLTIDGSLITDNVTKFAGGAIVNREGTFTITNSLIARNSAVLGGGLISLNPAAIGGSDPREGHTNMSSNCITGNMDVDPQTGKKAGLDGVNNDPDAPILNAANNWWGDSSGPGGSTKGARGKGDGAYGNVTFSPFLTAPPDSCKLTAAAATPVAIAAIPPTETPAPDCAHATDPRFSIQLPARGTPGVVLSCTFDAESMSLTIQASDSTGLPLMSYKFSAPVKVCLQGAGTISYVNYANPGLPAALPTTTENGYTCVHIPAPGVLLLQT